MKKSYLVILVIIGMILLSFAFTTFDEPPYKNLKVLPKSISKVKLDSVMKSFTRALGVKCDYCHARKQPQPGQQPGFDFASDENKVKLTARGMISMQYRINKKFFHVKNAKSLDAKLEISCYTCHNGKGIPAKIAPMQAPLPPGPPPPGPPPSEPRKQ